MNSPAAILLALLAALACAGLFYALLALHCVRHWLRDTPPENPAATLPPVTFFRPLKRGVPALRAKLDALAAALRPGDQLILGADEDSAELLACLGLRAAFPEREIVALACRPDAALNPKISKLLQMTPHARHAHWVVSDSEALLDAAWLDAFRREWLATRADALTAAYRFTNLATWPQRLAAAGALLALWPGLALVRRFGRVTFTLGACTALRRADVEAVGGWPAFGNFLAEDNRLGTALARAGKTIRLSTQIVTLDSDPLTWRDYWRQQRRVAVTYRVSAPAGFAGLIFTTGLAASVLLIACAPSFEFKAICLAFALLIQFARGLAFRRLEKILRFSIPSLLPVLLAATAVELACWLAAWCDLRIHWAGHRWCVTGSGRLVSEPQRR